MSESNAHREKLIKVAESGKLQTDRHEESCKWPAVAPGTKWIMRASGNQMLK